MLKYIVEESKELIGSVKISGAKNAALPIMGACILNGGVTKLYNVPNIEDVNIMIEILELLGCDIKRENESLIIDSSNATRL